MRVTVVDSHELGARFQDGQGLYNSAYFPYLQVLGRPRASEEERSKAIPVGPFAAGSGVLKGKETRFKEIFARVAGMGPHLWQPHAMGGAEYENGGFQAYVARAAMTGGMVAAEVEVLANTRMKPSAQMQSYMDVVKSLRKDWQDQYGVELPERSIEAKVYVIAPKDKIEAARWMVRDFSYGEIEHAAHRGIGLNRAVAYESLSDEDKKKVGEHNVAAWFEIQEGIFFTIDKDMAEKAKIAFAAQDYKPQQAAPKKRKWFSLLPEGF